MENSVEISQKLKIELPLIQQFHFWDWKKNENSIWKRYLHPIIIASLIIKAKIWNQPKCLSIDELLKV